MLYAKRLSSGWLRKPSENASDGTEVFGMRLRAMTLTFVLALSARPDAADLKAVLMVQPDTEVAMSVGLIGERDVLRVITRRRTFAFSVELQPDSTEAVTVHCSELIGDKWVEIEHKVVKVGARSPKVVCGEDPHFTVYVSRLVEQ